MNTTYIYCQSVVDHETSWNCTIGYKMMQVNTFLNCYMISWSSIRYGHDGHIKDNVICHNRNARLDMITCFDKIVKIEFQIRSWFDPNIMTQIPLVYVQIC